MTEKQLGKFDTFSQSVITINAAPADACREVFSPHENCQGRAAGALHVVNSAEASGGRVNK